MTLKGKGVWQLTVIKESFLDPDSGCDFNLDDFHAGPCETFDPHYGVKGYDGDGDITSLENLEAFQEYVLDNTDGDGVHFVMADGVRTSPHPHNITTPTQGW